MSAERPWTAEYPPGIDPCQPVSHPSLVAAWKARVAARPDGVALRYFDGTVTAAELDRASDALAVALAGRGTARGDRVGVYLQNTPHYVVVLLALWKIGAAALLLNPMYRRAELRRLVDDSGAVGIVCAHESYDETARTVAGSAVRWVVGASSRTYQSRDDARVFDAAPAGAPVGRGEDLDVLIRAYDGRRPPALALAGDDLALLTYTSGTTGPAKGAMNTHGSVLAVATTFGTWVGLRPGDVVLAVAPLFHITGAVINCVLALLNDTALVLTGRFHPQVVLEAVAEHGVTFTIGSITAFNALMQLPEAHARHFATVRHFYSGGAPIPPTTVRRFRDRFGVYLFNVYGMTETSSAVIGVPATAEAPVDPVSGTLSIGVPLPNLTARVVDASGAPLGPGEQGELELCGPQVIPGYWRNPEATARTLPGGRLRTGDVAVMDERGWFYLVDRLKDQINVSGYKVWPREVEDVLYEHPAVYEAAVVGRPDEYRVETVVAFVSLSAGAAADEAELIAFTRARLAAYKCPREVTFLPQLPKTLTGKIRRRELRAGLLDVAAARGADAGGARGGVS